MHPGRSDDDSNEVQHILCWNLSCLALQWHSSPSIPTIMCLEQWLMCVRLRKVEVGVTQVHEGREC